MKSSLATGEVTEVLKIRSRNQRKNQQVKLGKVCPENLGHARVTINAFSCHINARNLYFRIPEKTFSWEHLSGTLQALKEPWQSEYYSEGE